MTCMGIDPGIASTGVAVLEMNAQRPKILHQSVISTSSTEPIEHRLNHIYTTCCLLIKEYNVRAIALEKLYFGINVSSAFAVSEAIGVIRLAGIHGGLSIMNYSPNEVKKCVAGIGKASKHQVNTMISIILKIPVKNIPSHASDAIAVALTHILSHNGVPV